MNRGSETFRWEAREPELRVESLQHALGAWVHAATGRRQSDTMERRSEAFRWKASEPKPDVEPLQPALGAWVLAGAGR